MAKICIIDDDFASESLVEYLTGVGHDVTRYNSADNAFKALSAVLENDLIILDVMMEPPLDLAPSKTHGGHRTGLILAQEIKKIKNSLPIMAFSATQDKEVVNWFNEKENCFFINKLINPSMKEINHYINRLLGITVEAKKVKAFIVHGHDEASKLELKNYLQNTLKFSEPIILHEQPSLGKTILEKLEHYGSKIDVVFVLLTPDDVVASSEKSNEEKRRARQNVIFELGYFLGSFGRDSGRVFLLHKGPIELPSDIAGLIYIDIKDGVQSAGETIRKEISYVFED